MAEINFYNIDCIEFMKTKPDQYYDLAIVDPPYGIGFSDYERGSSGIKVKERYTKNGKKDWDKGIPTDEYFEQLKRVSKNQIIWGGNYFLDYLGNTSCFIVWDKDNGDNYYADCELAWASFDTAVRKVKYKWHGFLQGDMKNKENRIHPTQKPVKLYKWLLSNYANEGDRILDTHLGSGSIAVACDVMNFELVGCEIDEQYYLKAQKRYENERCQTKLF